MNKNQINPEVSFYKTSYFQNAGASLQVTNLYTLLKYCESITSGGKGKLGAFFPYKSAKLNLNYKSTGVIFVDIDHCSALSKQIYDSFETLAALIPNILAVNYSSSRNIHFFVYDHTVLEDGSNYRLQAQIWTAAIARAIIVTTGIDLRTIKGALDTHNTAPTQRFFIAQSEFKWNVNCESMHMGEDSVKKLRAEYKEVFKNSSVRSSERIISTSIECNGLITVDKNFNLFGYTGFEARSYIAGTTYVHFKRDLNASKDYLSATYSNADEIFEQLVSQVNNNYPERFYNRGIEEYLFGREKINGVIQLNQGEYLSKAIDFSALTGKYYYIKSNTNTGKTEFVKGILKENSNVILIQNTKALRDGKKQGIEEITYGNWDHILDKSKVHTTIEGFNRNCSGLDLSDYTIIVDESHLLEDYITVRREQITQMLDIISLAGRVIFMSATPKSDKNLFPFELLEFNKIQNQMLNIICHQIKYRGKGKKLAAKYQKLFEEISHFEHKTIIFSNRNQKEWKDFGGIGELDNVTLFNADNVDDPYVQSILQDNRLDNKITLATKYMGCGVEVKNEEEVNIVFLLDEGFDKDFIVQSIGRPRDAKVINLHIYYSVDDRKWGGYITAEDELLIKEAFKNLIINEDGQDKLNILSARILNLYDQYFNMSSVTDKIEMLITGNIITNRTKFDPYSIQLLKSLPYKEVNITTDADCEINTDCKTRRRKSEDDLQNYLINLSDNQWDNLKDKTYDEMYEVLPYNDKHSARKLIKKYKYMKRNNVKVADAVSVLGNIEKAFNAIQALHNYAKLQAAKTVSREFNGSEKVSGEWEKEFARVKLIFTEDYIESLVESYKTSSTLQQFNIDNLFEEFEKIDREEDETVLDISCFKNNSIEECISSSDSNRINRSEAVKIKIKETGEYKSFHSKSELASWMGVSNNTVTRFIKNKGNKLYELV